MFEKIIKFIKYHNAVSIGISLVLVLSFSAMAASNDARETVLGKRIILKRGVDNSAILTANLDEFDLAMKISDVSEDTENAVLPDLNIKNKKDNYYIDYTFKTFGIKNNIWQKIDRENTLVISKKVLGKRDLGIYANEEIGEVADAELAYLKEVQKREMEKGKTNVIRTVKYSGLIGLAYDIKNKVLLGYVPDEILLEPEIGPESSASPDPDVISEPTPIPTEPTIVVGVQGADNEAIVSGVNILEADSNLPLSEVNFIFYNTGAKIYFARVLSGEKTDDTYKNWSVSLDTTILDDGNYNIIAKGTFNGVIYENPIVYNVTIQNTTPTPIPKPKSTPKPKPTSKPKPNPTPRATIKPTPEPILAPAIEAVPADNSVSVPVVIPEAIVPTPDVVSIVMPEPVSELTPEVSSEPGIEHGSKPKQNSNGNSKSKSESDVILVAPEPAVVELFDIMMNIENDRLEKSSDLASRTQFISFGNVSTPVNLIYRIVDVNGDDVFAEMDRVTVETEQVIIKEFSNLNVGEGEYALILTTVYGNNVKDQFKQNFEVKEISQSQTKIEIIIWILIIMIIAGGGSYIVFQFIRRKK